jgi:hypothetical protein
VTVTLEYLHARSDTAAKLGRLAHDLTDREFTYILYYSKSRATVCCSHALSQAWLDVQLDSPPADLRTALERLKGGYE